ncbi:hypothetical protein ACP2AV_12235 [Aliiroseovarius sp. PTFE2010]|uniref:hypothetical protein n=1 Tax=Aliiroseovarius sp. PTFE2010 TaxID=3417190 RepID=UPI003CF0B3CE
MKAILLFVAALSFAAAPFMTTGFDGFDPTRYPIPQYDPPVQPAGYAFSIWGIIYVWLVIHAGFSLFKRDVDRDWDAPRWWLFASLTVGTSWLSVATFSPFWATVLIWFMLITALVALFRAPVRDPWLGAAPLALYAGWLSAASLVSVGMLGAGYGVLFGQIGWAYASIVAASTIAICVQLALGRAPLYGAGVVWGLIAIAVQNGAEQISVTVIALLGAALVAAAALGTARRPKGASTPNSSTTQPK